MCESAFDCSNNSLFRECYQENNFRDELDFCDCSSWFGWKGDFCNERGPTVYFRGVIALFLIFWNIFNFTTLGNTLRNHTKHILLKNQFKIKSINPVFYVMLLSLTATTLFIYVDTVRLLTAIDSTYFELAESTSLFSDDLLLEIVQKSNNIYFAIVVLSITLQGIAFMVISLSWLDVLRQFNELFDLNFCVSESKLQKMIGGTIILFSVSFLLTILLRAYTEFSAMFLLGAILLSVSYAIAYHRFKSSFKLMQFNQANSATKSALKLVRRSFQVTTVCFFGICVSNLVYLYGLFNFKEVLVIGGFNYFMIFDLAGTFFGYYALSYMSYYSFKVTSNLAGNGVKITWFPTCRGYQKRRRSLSQLNTRPSSQLSSVRDRFNTSANSKN